MRHLGEASENTRESFVKFAKALELLEKKDNQPREYIPTNKKQSKKYKIRTR